MILRQNLPLFTSFKSKRSRNIDPGKCCMDGYD
nr:MAG TPA: hypothetical protein [Caudoviricetes sp.]